MKPKEKSNLLLGVTRSKGKMYEYQVPEEYQLDSIDTPSQLMVLAIGLLGDYSSLLNSIPFEARVNNHDNDIKFSAYYFDAYFQSKLERTAEPYLILLGAASYYLSNLPGSSRVLLKHLGNKCPNLDGNGLEQFIYWLLNNRQPNEPAFAESSFRAYLADIKENVLNYFNSGVSAQELQSSFNNLKKYVYRHGTPRELLFTDVIGGIIRVSYENSTWRCLPFYSDLSEKEWETTIKKQSFIKELWPSQHILGNQGVFRGNSAVIQMPTSAGKTRATEIIIRSTFISKRSSLAVVVAPFKALCNEIRKGLSESFFGENVAIEEFSDVIQDDIQLIASSIKQQIYVVTPEKLVYVLRQAPEFANDIGLLIYDEGHQFDNGSRGVTYELLLTTLKNIVAKAQTILISAVLSNVQAINSWLNNSGESVISGIGLTPNFRSIAFTSWTEEQGKVIFIKDSYDNLSDYHIPRAIQIDQLDLLGREKKQKYFPIKSSGNQVSLYLGLKLVKNGGVALFCGTKATARSICKTAVDIFKRNVPLAKPSNLVDREELEALSFLHDMNLGSCLLTEAAQIGIYTHHNSIPTGIRLAIEHAMSKGLAHFVLCTSTLSQGVNLPIKYLIITDVHQGHNHLLTVRDFHNLIGRAGRSGMYTEGNVIFGNPSIYDNKDRSISDRRNWNQIQRLLQPERTEPCGSSLFSVFDNFSDEKGQYNLLLEILDFAKIYIDGPSKVEAFVEDNAKKNSLNSITKANLKEQVDKKVKIFQTIESYLMAYGFASEEIGESDIKNLSTSTLAHSLANEDDQSKMSDLFSLLLKNIQSLVPDPSRRRVYGKTLYGVVESLAIESWIINNTQDIDSVDNIDKFINTIWPLIIGKFNNRTYLNLSNKVPFLNFAILWANGTSFKDLYNNLVGADVKYMRGTQKSTLNIEHIIDLCQNCLSYEGSLAIGALSSIYSFINPESTSNLEQLKFFQKRIQYGLPNICSVTIYELGLSDRVIAIELSQAIGNELNRAQVIQEFKDKRELLTVILKKYPSFFLHLFEQIIGIR
jgi:POLQ-like helicase